MQWFHWGWLVGSSLLVIAFFMSVGDHIENKWHGINKGRKEK